MGSSVFYRISAIYLNVVSMAVYVGFHTREGSYGYQMLAEVSQKLEDAAKAKGNDACMLTVDKFTILCQTAAQGRNMR